MISQYSNIHRGFIQVVMSRGSISTDIANNVLTKLFASRKYKYGQTVQPTTKDLEDVIDEINEKIRTYDQRVDIVQSQYDDKTFVVIVNTTHSATMKLQSTYKPQEIEFFRLLMKEIALSEDLSLRKIHILNLLNRNRDRGVTISMGRLEKLLNNWIEEGYYYSKDVLIYFGVRSVTSRFTV